MAPVPLRRDDNSEPLQPGLPANESAHSSTADDIATLTSRLSEQGIQSSELVLDLVLHDLAEEALQAVHASGAAIALEQMGELVCRAAAGPAAPGLGIRINIKSGLCAICMRDGAPQLCNDTNSDERVDREAFRRDGVRSMAVVPVLSGQSPGGILEGFSADPNRFTTDDLKRLEVLAESIAAAVRKARRDFAPENASAWEQAVSKEVESDSQLSVAAIMQRVSPVDPSMKVLRGLVIGLAALVTVLLGFDLGWHKAHTPSQLTTSVPDTPAQLTGTAPKMAAEPPVEPIAREKRASKKIAPSENLMAQGGLVIFQNGRVIYRQGPSIEYAGAPAEATAGGAEPPGARAETLRPPVSSAATGNRVSEGRLVHSVKPTYPSAAVEQRVEGPVVLHGTIGKDGVIRELKVVRGDPMLSAAALDAVQQWRYDPYKRDGSPIEMPIDITIDFNLNK